MTLFEDVYAAAGAAVEETATPGTAIGLVHDGKEHSAGIGVTSVENPLEVTPETLFQIGSITKTVTGTLAMILVERGELDIDAPVLSYLPKLALAALNEDHGDGARDSLGVEPIWKSVSGVTSRGFSTDVKPSPTVCSLPSWKRPIAVPGVAVSSTAASTAA